MSLLPPKKDEREESIKLVEERSLLQSEIPTVQDYCAGDIAKTLKLFRSEVGEELSGDFLHYYARGEAGSYGEIRILSNTWLDD